MSYEIVHAFGAGVYCVFIALFILASRIPRTNSGANWWALAISCALIARLSFFYLIPLGNRSFAISVYGTFNILEKTFLAIGFVLFFDIRGRLKGLWFIAACAELWLLFSWSETTHPLVRSSSYSLYNVFIMTSMAYLILKEGTHCPSLIRKIISLTCCALAAHWLTAPVIGYFYSSWLKNGFVLGTGLVALQYTTLLAAILYLFQKRLVSAEAKALKMAFKDPLTGLYNKNFMNSLFDQALLLATRPHHIVAVYYIDLDNFKPINDTAGHAVGDQVLKCIAKRLKDGVRSTDICVRLGGDEFTVIATQLEHQEQAHDIAKKLVTLLADPVAVSNQEFVLGASIGVSLYPLHGSDLACLIEQADSAMYQVKSSGKGGYNLYAVSSV